MMPQLWIEPLWPLEEALDWTTPAEQAVARHFVSERRQREFLGWRALLRHRLGRDLEIGYNPFGAPVVNLPLHLSVSHCEGRLAVCVAEEPCGVDIEPAGRNFSRVAERVFLEAEREKASSPLLQGVMWCAKEALYKYAGCMERADFATIDFAADLTIDRIVMETTDTLSAPSRETLPVSGRLWGRIKNGEPVGLSVRLEAGYIVVFTPAFR